MSDPFIERTSNGGALWRLSPTVVPPLAAAHVQRQAYQGGKGMIDFSIYNASETDEMARLLGKTFAGRDPPSRLRRQHR